MGRLAGVRTTGGWGERRFGIVERTLEPGGRDPLRW
jgi:hypothetical protein